MKTDKKNAYEKSQPKKEGWIEAGYLHAAILIILLEVLFYILFVNTPTKGNASKTIKKVIAKKVNKG
jgi:hypothetical protein